MKLFVGWLVDVLWFNMPSAYLQRFLLSDSYKNKTTYKQYLDKRTMSGILLKIVECRIYYILPLKYNIIIRLYQIYQISNFWSLTLKQSVQSVHNNKSWRIQVFLENSNSYELWNKHQWTLHTYIKYFAQNIFLQLN